MASIQNLASGVLSADITTSATTITVSCGTGTASALTGVWPATPFYITVMPSVPAAGVANSLDSEVMLVTAKSSSGGVVSMTVTRAQRGTTAKAFSQMAIVTNGIYIDDILDRIYPVGSIYMSATLSPTSQVEAALGGTWVAWGSGKVPVGVNTSDADFDTVEETGGSKTHNHPLGNNGAAGVRNYGTMTYVVTGANTNSLWKMDGTTNSVWAWSHNGDSAYGTDLGYSGVRLYGRTEDKTIMPPYITCYMYKRTA